MFKQVMRELAEKNDMSVLAEIKGKFIICDNKTGNEADIEELETGEYKVHFSVSGQSRIFRSVAGLNQVKTLINLNRELGV